MDGDVGFEDHDVRADGQSRSGKVSVHVALQVTMTASPTAEPRGGDQLADDDEL